MITAGPTWVPIDDVRVISNIATGSTGILLAEQFLKQGAKVTLLFGPAPKSCCIDKKIRCLKFNYFEELLGLIKKELKTKYDIIIHSAAVSDYQPAAKLKGKVNSERTSWLLELKPTLKIIDLIRKENPEAFITGFKFEPQAKEGNLLEEARDLIRRAQLDIAVANTISKNKYRAYVVDAATSIGPFFTRIRMAKRLIKLIEAYYG